MSDKVKNVHKVYLPPKSIWMNQRVLFATVLFGKEYYWLKDSDGTVYLAGIGKSGEPVIL